MKRLLVAFAALIIAISAGWIYATNKKPTFQQYLSDIKKRALKAGVSQKTIDKYMSNIAPPKKPKKSIIIQNQKHQAAAVDTFAVYKTQFIPNKILPYAHKQYRKYLPLLKRVEKQFHVQPRFVTALWGIESDYGRYTGDFPLIRSLAVLGYHHHRSAFYKRQLVDALVILNRPKVIPEMLKSAWDGGMGQPQFEPASYLSYGVDFNKDGFVNIWTSMPDVFASIANFLHQNGWNGKQTWGMEVKVPKNFPIKKSGYPLKHSISYWRKLGVTQLNGRPLKNISGKTAILLPDGIKGRAFIIYPNFKVLMRWNNITFEGLCVGLLSDALQQGKLKT